MPALPVVLSLLPSLVAPATLRFLAPTQLGADVAFYAVFGVFVVAFVVLCVVSITWAVRRDRVGRQEWLRRQRPNRGRVDPGAVLPSRSNGHVPHGAGPKGSQRKRRR